MGNAAYRQTTGVGNAQNLDQDLRSFMQVDLPKFVQPQNSKIGNGKFTKTYVMRVDTTQVVAKVYLKLPEEDLQLPIKQLTHIWKTIPPTKYPSLMPYQMWIRSSAKIKATYSPVYLIRQYFSTNLFDRVSTRPFLNELEKYWIIYQLLKCLEICHEYEIVHGDIKLENIMCTSANWVVLTDFSPYKPVLLPDDDLTDFQYYFDAMSRNRCTIAPERFYHHAVEGRWSRGVSDVASGASTPPPKPTTFTREQSKTGQTNPEVARAKLTTCMDVFSLGCVMAEVLLDGTSLLDLPTMLRYLSSSADTLDAFKEENANMKQLLGRIKNSVIRDVIIDMTAKDPMRRLSASKYLKILLGKDELNKESSNKMDSQHVLPDYFENCIYPLYLKLHWNGVTPDDRIAIICESYEAMIDHITGQKDIVGAQFFTSTTESNKVALLNMDSRSPQILLSAVPQVIKPTQFNNQNSSKNSQKAIIKKDILLTALPKNLRQTSNLEAKESQSEIILNAKNYLTNLNLFIEKLSQNSQQIPSNETKEIEFLKSQQQENSKKLLENFQKVFFHHSDYFLTFQPNENENKNEKSSKRIVYEGFVLIIDLLCSQYRHLKLLHSRLLCLLLLSRLGSMSTDQVILQRIIPIMIIALEDPAPSVKVTAIRVLTTLLSLVQTFEPAEVNFFPQYIFPSLARVSKDTELIVRLAFAESLACLGTTAKRFLMKGHMIHIQKTVSEALQNANTTDVSQLTIPIDYPFESKLETLKESLHRWIRDLVLESSNTNTTSPNVNNPRNVAAMRSNMLNYSQFYVSSNDAALKKVLLSHIMELCHFFGQESTVDKLLTQLFTFLNDPDWELRASFCRSIPQVAAFVGASVTSEYIVTLLENTIYDVEERVVVCAIQALQSLVTMGLVSKQWLVEDYLIRVRPLLLHASQTVRIAALSFVTACLKTLSITDTAVYVIPALQDVLRYPLLPTAHKEEYSAELLSLVMLPSISRENMRSALLKELDLMARQSVALGPGAFAEQSYSINAAAGRVQEWLGSALVPAKGLNKSNEGSTQNSQEDNVLQKTNSNEINQINEANEDFTNQQIEILRPYLASAAKEIYTKALRWRTSNAPLSSDLIIANLRWAQNDPNNSNNSSNISTITAAFKSSNAALNWFQTPFFESSSSHVNGIKIPLLKLASSLSEEYRKRDIYLDNDEVRNLLKIKTVFSGHSGDVVAVTATSYTDSVQEPSLPMSPSNFDDNSAGPGIMPPRPPMADTVTPGGAYRPIAATANTTALNYTNTDSLALLRRLQALKVPPLPPDFGALLQVVSSHSGLVGDDLYRTGPAATSDGGMESTSSGVMSGSVAGSVNVSTPANISGPPNVSGPASLGAGTIGADPSGSTRFTRPREPVLLMTLREHSAAVNRLVISPDHSFFVSASSDNSCRIWQTRALDRMAFPRSAAMYSGHTESVLDAVAIEHSHSVASAGKEGSVHVWRVDMVGSNPLLSNENTQFAATQSSSAYLASTVTGTAMVRHIDPAEGAVMAVQHYNTDVASVVTFLTQRGGLHGWDLRMPKEAFYHKLRPELGTASCLCVAPDRNWLCFGTTLGAVMLYDVRYQALTSGWRHSSYGPIHRLASCKMPSLQSAMNRGVTNTSSLLGLPALNEGSYLFCAAGDNEAAIFGVPEGGDCLKCFRSLPLNASRQALQPLPSLEPLVLPRHASACFPTLIHADRNLTKPASHSIRAMLGRISTNNSSHLITAGSDRIVRYWDFRSADHCFVLCGNEAAQPKALFRHIRPENPSDNSTNSPDGRLIVCYNSAVPTNDKILQSQLPMKEGKGLVLPSPNPRDCILDLKELTINLDFLPANTNMAALENRAALASGLPMRLLVSGARDGEIKLWR